MKTSRRTFLARIMNDAWALARQGAAKFGGSVKLYFAIALHLIWQDRQGRPVSVWHKGLGNQFWMPGLPVTATINSKGQLLLPGVSGK